MKVRCSKILFWFLGVFFILEAVSVFALENSDLIYRKSINHWYGEDGLELTSSNAISHPGHVGVYVKTDYANRNDRVIEPIGNILHALSDEIENNPRSEFCKNGDTYMGAKTWNGNVTTFQRENMRRLALNAVGLGYDTNLDEQKGPGVGDFTCVGFAEKIWESANSNTSFVYGNSTGIPTVFEYTGQVAYENESNYAFNITPGCFEYNIDIGMYFSENCEFSEVLPISMGREFQIVYNGDNYIGDFVFFPCTQFIQPTLKDVSDMSIDLVFIIDTTGSMWDDIAAAKAAAVNIVDEIDSQTDDYRIAVVCFEDFPYYPYGSASWGDYMYHDVLNFSNDKASIVSAIQGLVLRNGMDWPESHYSALIHCFQKGNLGGWRDNPLDTCGRNLKKVAILITDAPPHDPEPYTGYIMQDVIDAAIALDPVVIYPIFIGGDSIARAYMEGLADGTEGQVFVASGAGEVVEAIMEAIETTFNAPIADANGPYTGTVGSLVTLDGSGSCDTDGVIVSYEWDFNNDGTYDQSVTTPTTTYSYAAEYSGLVKLRVTDNDGLTGIDTASVEVVGNQPPVANAGPDRIVAAGAGCMAAVTLNGLGSSDPDGNPLTYTWTWNGNSANGVSPTIQLPLGITTITLVVNDGTEDSEPDEVKITVEDTTPPATQIISPASNQALQDGVILTANASDACGVAEVYFYIREADGGSGIQIGYEDLLGAYNGASWEYSFETNMPLTPDGYYVILTKAVDTNGNEGWSTPVPVSIRNWAVIELLPNTANNKAGRTMPVKFALRIAVAVDPAQPFVYNQELEIRIYDASGVILQTSLYGDASTDYRIDTAGELYITNFKTSKKPTEYVVEIWRMSKNFLIGSFAFETVK